MLEKITDIDSGAVGKKFEDHLLKAFDLIGLSYDKNQTGGAGWDFRPTGAGWKPLIGNKDVNIKVFSARWLFASSGLTKMLPWDKVPEDYDFDKAAKKIRALLIKRGAHKLWFLKPKGSVIQAEILKAVKDKDGERLVELLVKRNFKVELLGRGFEVKVSKRGDRIGSISIIKDGKVFGRSERPRDPVGVAFKMPKGRKMPQTNVAKKGTEVNKKEDVEEMSPGMMSNPTAVALEKAFTIAKKWDKTWTGENRKYKYGFGFIKAAGVFFQVSDKSVDGSTGTWTQMTGLNHVKLAQLLTQYNVRFSEMKPLLDFADKKKGKKLKGKIPATVRSRGTRLSKKKRSAVEQKVRAIFARADLLSARTIVNVDSSIRLDDAEKVLRRIGKVHRTKSTGERIYTLDPAEK